MELINTAEEYLKAGLSVCPATLSDKFPTGISWSRYQTQRMRATSIANRFKTADAICIVCGLASENLEVIDFDDTGSCFDDWLDAVKSAQGDLWLKLVIERSPSGGYHVFYRSPKIEGNLKLAQKIDAGQTITLIETRGIGGLVLCDPSPGYQVIQGSLECIQTITAKQRDFLIECARSFHRSAVLEPDALKDCGPADESSPWYDYNQKGTFKQILERRGWVKVRDPIPGDDNERWRRPGKEKGWSATINDKYCFYNWSSNSPKFEPERGYSPFQVYTHLEHNGDFKSAARTLGQLGFGQQDNSSTDLTGILKQSRLDARPEPYKTRKIPPFPKECLRPPGLLEQIIDHNLRTALFPQPELALAGALSLMGTITGRKVCDSRNARTNVYVLGLAPSGSGKEHARAINKDLLLLGGEAGERMIGPEGLGSSAGFVSFVSTRRTLLFQLDEIARIIETMQDSRRNPHLHKIGTEMMKIESSSNKLFVGDAYADQKKTAIVNQPHACVYGTATPESFWESLTIDNVTEGLLGRIMVLEAAGGFSEFQPAEVAPPPESLLEGVRFWLDMPYGAGNFSEENPSPQVIPYSAAAKSRIDSHYKEICRRRMGEDNVSAALWSRTIGKTAKLALLFACSRCTGQDDIVIELADVNRAVAASNWMTRRMLMQVGRHVSVNKREEQLKKILRLLETPMSRSELTKKTQGMYARERNEILIDLLQTGQITSWIDNKGKPNEVELFQTAEP